MAQNKAGKCILVGAGDLPHPPTVRPDDFVIAADGGYSALAAFGICPDLLVGDFDSLDAPPEGVRVLRHPTHKDETDMYLSYLAGAERGYADFEIYGGTGGRADHTFANIQTLWRIEREGRHAVLFGDGYTARVVEDGSAVLHGTPGDGLSVFALSPASGVTLTGTEYTLTDAPLSPSVPLGVSNRFCDTEVSVRVGHGALLLICRPI